MGKRPARTKSLPAESPTWGELLLAVASITIVSIAALCFFLQRDQLLWYGDAQAHLANARRMVDSRTPDYAQIGTGWLPLLHFLELPFAGNDELYRTGLAGSIPAMCCFILAAACLYLVTRWTLGTRVAAATATALFVLNPNMLYLQSAPMTEPVFLGAAIGLLACTIWFQRTQSTAAIVAAGFASLAASLTRYEGWFLIPFVTAFFLFTARERRLRAAILFGAIASIGPLYWFAHNWRYYGDPLEFYHGEYSAKAIYQRALDKGMARYPGDRDWRTAVFYLRTAVENTAGWSLCVLGVMGSIAALIRRAWWVLFFFLFAPAFVVWSMYDSNVPIFVPSLEPHGYYNTRYSLSSLPLLAYCAAALVALIPAQRGRTWVALAIIGLGILPWLRNPQPDAWLCWKESQVNSVARRAWTDQTAAYLKPIYRPGAGIFTSLGDLTGIFRVAGIPMRELLQDGNNPQWMITVVRPDLLLWEEWVVAQSGDAVSDAMHKWLPKGLPYQCVKMVEVPGAPAIEIYRRK